MIQPRQDKRHEQEYYEREQFFFFAASIAFTAYIILV